MKFCRGVHTLRNLRHTSHCSGQRFKRNYRSALSVAIVSVIALLTSASWSFGAWNMGSEPCSVGEGCARYPMSRSRIKVFAVAPTNSTWMWPGPNVVSSKENAPPPYTSFAVGSEQFAQFSPSKICSCEAPIATWFNLGPSLGTRGIALRMSSPIVMAGDGEDKGSDCAHVDAWIPESMKSMENAAVTNDPNDSMTLDIIPSPHGSNPALGAGAGPCKPAWVFSLTPFRVVSAPCHPERRGNLTRA